MYTKVLADNLDGNKKIRSPHWIIIPGMSFFFFFLFFFFFFFFFSKLIFVVLKSQPINKV